MHLVYLSPVPWNSVAQRPHFFIKHALKNGIDSVLWIEPTPSRLPRLTDFKTKLITTVEANSFKTPENIKIEKIITIPIEPLGKIYDIVNFFQISSLTSVIKKYSENHKTILVIGKPSRLSNLIVLKPYFEKKIFDVMDDFPYFFDGISRASVKNILKQLIANSDLCVFSSENLLVKYKNKTKDSMLILNACDDEFNDKVQKTNKQTNLVFGYIGSIAEWFDWDVVIKLANKHKNAIFKIIGPCYLGTLPDLPDNIVIIDAIEHSEVANRMSEFNYGLIPFKKNKLTNSVDPVKYYEYVSTGCIVISTGFGEMSKRIKNQNVLTFDDCIYKNIIPEEIVTWSARFKPLWKYLN